MRIGSWILKLKELICLIYQKGFFVGTFWSNEKWNIKYNSIIKKYTLYMFTIIFMYKMANILAQQMNPWTNRHHMIFFMSFFSQRPRIDLNKKFLPRPNTFTAWKLIPIWSKISKNWNPSQRWLFTK